MIDLHTHILPGVDDGAVTLEDSIAMARVAVADGITVMAATSHVHPDLSVVVSEVAGRVAALNEEFRALDIGLEVVVGGEIAVSKVLDLSDDDLMALRLGGGPFLLVEAPLSVSVMNFEPVLYDLQARGHGILLAHPERCPAILREPARLDALVADGMLVQLTAGSLTGQFGDIVRRFSVDLLRRGLVHVVSSDAHDADRRPPRLTPGLDAARRWVGGLTPGHREVLTTTIPNAVLGRAEMVEVPPLEDRPAFWRRALRRA